MSSTWLMQTIMSAQVLVFFAVIYRFLITILGALIGGGVLLLDLRDWANTRQPRSAKKPITQDAVGVKTALEKD